MNPQRETRIHAQDVRMSAAVYRRFGSPEVVRIEDAPKPSPGHDEVLVRVRASTVSAADHRARGRTIPNVVAGRGLTVRPLCPVEG
ncbi:hypothetical protein E3O19_10275 [Cryobacterium algoritolerans]|uniref:NAD(P)-dependent alcohol dehydrogenase n=1 Tax=Cryobacterium algoritolerans TaxID=1259184 RepID=A0A4R8WQT2_9MICO|nr:hypothetical protein [Cryobacterium algoritolerans]TFC14580.1 hypothetical protein E3O19_10275 [Cryobacterium algoritolerans]